jgi:porin
MANREGEEQPTDAGGTGAATPGEAGTAATSANPAAVNIISGTGALGRFLGIDPDSGFRLGGLWIGDSNGIMTGGVEPGRWGLNSLTIADLNVDAEKAFGWRGGMFGTEFLQFTGDPTNNLAGAYPGFNSLPVTPPFVRQELYQLWWRQSLFNDKLIFRIGKSVPTYDFNNVVRPVPVDDPAASIPAVTSLIFTPVFVNPTILGKIPGYYNSATGVTVSLAPTDNFYLSYGFYDGNLAQGEQTGLRGPQFNGHYFHIGEAGYAYRVGDQKKPGSFGIGGWGQTGPLQTPNNNTVTGVGGFYLFGSQRLWFRNPGQDNSGVSGFYQYGVNNSDAMLAREYFGMGLTGFGLIPGRPDDSMGFGLALTWLNTDPQAGRAFFPNVNPKGELPLRSSELMFQWYYQMQLTKGVFLQPAITYIPTPGMSNAIPATAAGTMRLIVLF